MNLETFQYDNKIPKLFAIATIFWGTVGMLLGVIIAFQLVYPVLNFDLSLEAELEARRRQYQYYRDALLPFRAQDVHWAAMAEVGEFIRGRRFTKADYVEDGVACIHYGDIYTQYGTATTETVSHVRSEHGAYPALRQAG